MTATLPMLCLLAALNRAESDDLGLVVVDTDGRRWCAASIDAGIAHARALGFVMRDAALVTAEGAAWATARRAEIAAIVDAAAAARPWTVRRRAPARGAA